jgi:hypothetical protein
LIDGRELYDVQKDPEQALNIGPENPQVVDRLRFQYEQWYKDVSARFGEYCPIVLGSPRQNPTTLTCHDWHSHPWGILGADLVWDQRQLVGRPQANGFWAVEIGRAGRYRFTLRERPAVVKYPLHAGAARLKIGEVALTEKIQPGTTGVTFECNLQPGKTHLQTWLARPAVGGAASAHTRPPRGGAFSMSPRWEDGAVRGAYLVEVEYLGPAAGEKDSQKVEP